MQNAYQFELMLLDGQGDDLSVPANYDEATVFARTLNITGGGDNGAGTPVDTVVVNSVTNVLSLIDFSDYEGEVAALNLIMLDPTVDRDSNAGGDQFVDRNVTIRFNDQKATITETDENAANDDGIVTYEFTSDIANAGDVWTINNFDTFASEGLSGLSILDVSGLGITGLADLSIVDDGTDTIVTANDPAASGLDFEIKLTGLTGGGLDALNNENFQFA